jgi:hypothetical protein
MVEEDSAAVVHVVKRVVRVRYLEGHDATHGRGAQPITAKCRAFAVRTVLGKE